MTKPIPNMTYPEVQFFCVNLLIYRSEPRNRRNHAPLEQQDGLDNACQSTAAFQVADVRLDGTDIERVIGCPVCLEGSSDGVSFDGIPDRRPCTVSLEEAGWCHINVCLPIGAPDELNLSVSAGLGNTGCPSILVGAGVANHGSNCIPVP